jgi:hypothetical protein
VRGGAILLADETPRSLPEPNDAYRGLKPVFREEFGTPESLGTWKQARSERPVSAAVEAGELVLRSTANTCVFLEKELPPGVRLVECRLNSGTDGGQTWGVGIGLVWPSRFARIHLRTEDRRLGGDDTGTVLFGPAVIPGTWQHVRIRIEEDRILLEGKPESARRPRFRQIAALNRADFPGDPVAIRIGKMTAHGTNEDFPEPGREGECRIRKVVAYAAE